MMDEIFDRNYQSGRADLNDSLERALRAFGTEIRKSLRAIHAVQWSAPWAGKPAASKKPGCA